MLLPVEESELQCKDLVSRLVQLDAEHGAVWRSGRWSLTVNGETATLDNGRIVQHYDCDQTPNSPTIHSIDPLCMVLGSRQKVRLRGRCIAGDGFRVSLTREGKCYTLPAQADHSNSELSIDVHAVREGANLVQVSEVSDSRVSNTVPIIVVNDYDVCDEINRLVETVSFRHKGCTTLLSVIWQLGRVLAHGVDAASKPSLDELETFCTWWGLRSAKQRLLQMRPQSAHDVPEALTSVTSWPDLLQAGYA